MLYFISLGGKKMPLTPDPEHIHIAIKWWQEILAGTMIILFGWWAKTKGKENNDNIIIPLSEEHINNKIKINHQEILLEMNEMLKKQEESIIKRVKEIIGK